MRFDVGIVGAGGQLGRLLVSEAIASGASCLATYRYSKIQALNDEGGVTVKYLDLNKHTETWRDLLECHALVITPILSTSEPFISWLRSQKYEGRVVAFSSNNVGLDPDNPVYSKLQKAEGRVLDAGGDTLLIRPTMIYGYPGDGNLSRLMRFAFKYRALPLFGSGRALQQPIHVMDLAKIAFRSLQQASPPPISCAAGPASHSLRELYESVFDSLEMRRAIFHVPTWPLGVVASFSERLGLKMPISTAQLKRIELDKVPTLSVSSAFAPKISLAEGLKRLADDLIHMTDA